MKESTFIRIYFLCITIAALFVGASFGFYYHELQGDSSSLFIIIGMIILVITLIIGGKKFERIIARL